MPQRCYYDARQSMTWGRTRKQTREHMVQLTSANDQEFQWQWSSGALNRFGGHTIAANNRDRYQGKIEVVTMEVESKQSISE